MGNQRSFLKLPLGFLMMTQILLIKFMEPMGLMALRILLKMAIILTPKTTTTLLYFRVL